MLRRSPMLVVSLWGKGGVGKSTLAAALASLLAERGLRVALVSTDPFPSILEVVGGGEPGRWIEACGFKLLAVTGDYAAREWRRLFGDSVYRVFSLLFDVDKETLLRYLEQAPWVIEQLHMYIVLLAAREHDAVVWDTMGAGGGLLALELEEKLYRHLRLAPRIYSRLRGTVSGIDRVIGEWRRLAEEILAFVKSEDHKPVIVGDAQLGPWHIEELYKYIATHREPQAVILNRFLERDVCEGCPYTRVATLASRETLERVKRLGKPVYTVPWLPERPVGCVKITLIARYLDGLVSQLL